MSEGRITADDGTAIGYERRGQGPPLVLVHGAFVDRTFWGPSLPLLAQHYTVYAMDRRGHGTSGDYPPAAHDHTIEREYRDVSALLATIAEPAYLLGHSAGARVALHAARRSPQVRTLVLYEPPSIAPVAPEIITRVYAALAAGDIDTVVATALIDVVGGAANPDVPPEALDQMLAGMRQSPIWAAVARNARGIPAELESHNTYHFDPAEFRAFATPTVLLLGGSSGPMMQHWVADLQADLPNSKIVILDGQGHGAMLEAPELFTHAVRDACAWTPGSRPESD